MNSRAIFAHFILILISFPANNSVRYDGYKVYRVIAKTNKQVEAMWKFTEFFKPLFWDTITFEVGEPGSPFILAPHQQGRALEALIDAGLNVTGIHPDIQKLFDSQQAVEKADGHLNWKSYNRLNDIYQYLHNLKNESLSNFKEISIDVFSIGKSIEGRDILCIRVFKNSTSNDKRPSILIDSNIHAREWISSAVSTFLLNEVIYSDDSEISSWTEYFDFYIIPVLNPDGFEYSHTTDRRWRKNRSKYNSSNSFLPCRGADLNRNFDFYWNELGTSNDPCSEVYPGSSALSEPEALAFTNFVNQTFGNDSQNDLRAYFSLHSFDQAILIPYGSTTETIDDFDEQVKVVTDAAEAHSKRYGTEFKVGNTAKIYYPFTGSSADWIKFVHKVPLALTCELRDKGHFGFYLPADQIIPSALEFIDGFKIYMRNMIDSIDSRNEISSSESSSFYKDLLWKLLSFY